MTGFEGLFGDIGRMLVGFLFVFFGVSNAMSFKPISGLMAQMGIPMAPLALAFGIVWEAACGAMIMLNIQTQLAALALVPFVLIAVFQFHAFWKHEGEARQLHMVIFVANMTVTLGPLLLLAAG